jgi:hypothetical protein
MPRACAAAPPAAREPAPLLLRHAFLQAVMARAYLPESDAKLLAARVLDPDSGAPPPPPPPSPLRRAPPATNTSRAP